MLSELTEDSMKIPPVRRCDAMLKLVRGLDRQAQQIAKAIDDKYPEWKEITEVLWRLT